MSRPAVAIPEKLFFKIGEVCELAGVQAHVLRYWESEFPMLAPQKNRAGQRVYRKRDVEMALRIKAPVKGQVGTILGRHGINVANFALGRSENGAVGVVTVDDPDGTALSKTVMDEIRQIPAIQSAWAVRV